MKPTPRIGRPPKPAAEKQSETLIVKVTPAERRLLARAAKGQPLAVWMRGVLVRAAKKR